MVICVLGTKSLPRRRSNDASRRGLGDGSTTNETSYDPSEYMLSLMDIMEMRLKAKLVVISACHRSEGNTRLTAEGLMVMGEGLLASGAECVLLPLWPTSLQGSRLMMKAFYSSLLYGSRASRALAYAMQVRGRRRGGEERESRDYKMVAVNYITLSHY